MTGASSCPCCGARESSVFHQLSGVPAHSVRLLSSAEAARAVPRGDLRLELCGACGFITNTAFDPKLIDYSPGYEGTQAHSPAFNRFHRQLAARLIDQYDLHGKDIVEIGCGQGEFLGLLCAMGPNRGVGFDPSYRGAEGGSADSGVRIIKDVFSDAHPAHRADFYCCKMTLEHLPKVRPFMDTLSRAAAGSQAPVFIQVPEVSRILRDGAFWDLYYEHCSYFDAGSLAALLEGSGFTVLGHRHAYDGQYLMVEARAGAPKDEPGAPIKPATVADVDRFRRAFPERAAAWRSALRAQHGKGRRTVLWGAGSKAVAFLATLGLEDEIAFTVDVNPLKQGTYLAGTGHAIAAPERLQTEKPDWIIVMNPVYEGEIQNQLKALGVAVPLVCVDSGPGDMAGDMAGDRT